MALKCTQQAKFQFSATEIRWGESGPVDITETWLASNERESQSQCGIGQDIIWICKFLLQWDDLKPFLLNSWCLNWLNDWCLVLGNSLYLVSLAVRGSFFVQFHSRIPIPTLACEKRDSGIPFHANFTLKLSHFPTHNFQCSKIGTGKGKSRGICD